MFSWSIGIALAVVAATLAILYLWLIARRKNETRAGLQALASLRWREFSMTVRQALQEERGLQDEIQHNNDSHRETNSHLLMTRGEERWLVLCKHSRAYRIGKAAVDELKAAIHLDGATGGILLTEGSVEREAVTAAATHRIEVLDGRKLWPLLKSHIDPQTLSYIEGDAKYRARRHSLIAVLCSLMIGLLVAVGLPDLQSTPAAAETVTTPPPSAKKTVPISSPTAGALRQNDPDDATLAQYQRDISLALSRIPGITRGVWITRSTLVVDRYRMDNEIWPLICIELERYPSLRTVRVQINPAPGSDEPVHWRQCQTI